MTFVKTMTTEERFWSKVKKTDGCWVWLASLTHNGYGRFALNRRKTVRANRFSLELVLGRPLGPGMEALHTCDNEPCVRSDHLFEGTQADNMADRDAKGRTARGDRSGARTRPEARPRGSNHKRSKLTEEKVMLIRDRLRSGSTQQLVAMEFGIAKPTVSHIVAGRTWRHAV